MIFELAQDFHDAVAAMPKEHPKHRMLELLEEAIRRDIHFIARHPTTLFQCMWNTCWWYDCSEAAKYYEEPESGWLETPLGERTDYRLCDVLEDWLDGRRGLAIGTPWLRVTCPPANRLGTGPILNLVGHLGGVTSMAFSPDGKRLATASWDVRLRKMNNSERDDTVRIWDVDTGRELVCFKAGEYGIGVLAYSPDGKLLATGCKARCEPVVRIHDAQTGTELARCVGHTQPVTAIAFSPDSAILATGSYDGTVRLWIAATGRQLRVGTKHGEMISDLAFSSDGYLIGSIDSSGMLKVWHVRRGIDLGYAKIELSRNQLPNLAFSSDGAHVLTADGHEVKLWRIVSGVKAKRPWWFIRRFVQAQSLECIRSWPHNALSMVCLPGVNLLAGWFVGSVRVMEFGSGQEAWRVNHAPFNRTGKVSENVRSMLVFSPITHLLAVLPEADSNRVEVFDIQRGQSFSLHLRTTESVGLEVTSPDGQFVANSTSQGVHVGAMHGNEPPIHLDCKCQNVSILGFSADSTLVIVVGEQDLWLYAASTGCLCRHERFEWRHEFSLSPKGECYAVDLGDRVVVYSLCDGLAQRGLQLDYLGERLVHEVLSLAFSPDSNLLVVSSCGRSIYLWNLRRPSYYTVPQGDNNIMVSSGKHACEIWRAEDYQGIVPGVDRVKDCRELANSQNLRVYSLAFSANGRRIAGFSEYRNESLVWDVVTRELVEVVPGCCDSRALAEGPQTFPFRAMADDIETTIRVSVGAWPIAWLPATGDPLRALNGGVSWESCQGTVRQDIVLEDHR